MNTKIYFLFYFFKEHASWLTGIADAGVWKELWFISHATCDAYIENSFKGIPLFLTKSQTERMGTYTLLTIQYGL